MRNKYIVFLSAAKNLIHTLLRSFGFAVAALRMTCARGFTMMEMAVVITILALVATGGLTLMARSVEDEREQTTRDRMEFIMQTIEQYVDANNALPCPANGALTIELAQYSLGGTPAAGACPNEEYTTSSGNIVIGAVPAGTLQISPLYMLDGWGRRFTYVVDQDMVTALAGMGSIQVQDAASPANDLITGPDYAAVLIISHGKNGYGAWGAKGNGGGTVTRIDDGRATNQRDMEDDNVHRDDTWVWNNIFRSPPLRTVAGSPADTDTNEYFDDILIYRTVWQLQD